MNIYYVYAYIRKSNGTPYYIGKGATQIRTKEQTESAKLKLKGRIVSEEHKKKISNTLKGHFVSGDTRLKISNSLKERNRKD